MNGTLGKSMTQAGAFVTPYPAPANIDFATISIFAVNQGPAVGKLRIAITTQATNPSPEDYIEYDAVIPAEGGILERTCIPVSASEKVMVYCDVATVAVRVCGLEQPLSV